MPDTDKPVTFLLEGREVSNDPRYKLQQMEEQMRARLAREAAEEDVTDDDAEKPYLERDVPSLKALAKEREIDLSGVKKKSELVALLEADDAAKADQGSQGD